MGGGEEPPMDELKNWMWEKVEVNVTGMQGTAPEVTHIDVDMMPSYNQFDEALPYTQLPFEPAQAYDWTSTQLGADLVNESCHFMTSTGSAVDHSFVLASQHHPQTFNTRYIQ